MLHLVMYYSNSTNTLKYYSVVYYTLFSSKFFNILIFSLINSSLISISSSSIYYPFPNISNKFSLNPV